jgi:hypothetical protein
VFHQSPGVISTDHRWIVLAAELRHKACSLPGRMLSDSGFLDNALAPAFSGAGCELLNWHWILAVSGRKHCPLPERRLSDHCVLDNALAPAFSGAGCEVMNWHWILAESRRKHCSLPERRLSDHCVLNNALAMLSDWRDGDYKKKGVGMANLHNIILEAWDKVTASGGCTRSCSVQDPALY